MKKAGSGLGRLLSISSHSLTPLCFRLFVTHPPIHPTRKLEAFLIANRSEYLRHSTLNYTVQQRKYNTLLTDRTITHALDLGYEFDESDFSFVVIRDRIRCYYKSYVQAQRKRGVYVGWAAKRRGVAAEK